MADLFKLTSTKELTQMLECPICTEIPLPPIFGCENGHVICNNCKAKMQQCGLCRAPFSTVRNHPMESIVNSSMFRCKYEQDGCQERVMGDQYTQHIQLCDFSPVICNHSTKQKCKDQLIPFGKFITHITQNHGLSLCVIPPNHDSAATRVYSAPTSANAAVIWPVLPVKVDNYYFFIRNVIKEGMLMIWVTHFGSAECASRYKAKVTVFNKIKQVPKIEWTIPIYDFRLSREEMLVYVSIPTDQLKNIADKISEDSLTWSVTYQISMIR